MSQNGPHFLIVGAQKSGTTSLADALNRHSRIFVCEPMEPEFFAGQVFPEESSLSRSEYEALFALAPRDSICGEASTGTMLSEEVIPHLEERASDARLIALLRSPEKRAFSAFTHDCKKGRVTFEEQSSIFEEEAEAYLNGKRGRFDWFDRSEYARQLEPFVERFGSRLKIVIFEELLAAPEEELKAVQEFLGVKPEPLSLTRENRSRVPKSKAAELLIDSGRCLVRPLRNLMNERGYRRFREFLMTRLGKDPDPFPLELFTRLRTERYCSEIHRLEKLLGRRILSWKE